MSISRRQAMQIGGIGIIGAFGLAVPLRSVDAKSASRLAARNMPKPYQATLKVPSVLPYYRTSMDADGHVRRHYRIQQQLASANIVPGLNTPILGYNGTFPGPTIKVEQGERVSLMMDNVLPLLHPQWGYRLDTSTHLHGSASLPQFDGYANDVTGMGYCKDYEYPNFQPARTLWYHDHAVHNTAQSVYSGLAGQYHLHDDVERNLLPQDKFDVPLTVSDAMFDANGALAYDDNTHSGLWGDIILVNGAPWPVMKVQRRIYRFRILNASISRSYRFSLSTGDPVTMVATDGGLMPAAQQVASWRHASAERYEILIDFSKYPAGKRVELRNLSNANNVDYDNTGKVMAFDVTGDAVDTSGPAAKVMPTLLASSNTMSLTTSQSVKTRQMRVKRDNEIWTIGGMTWNEVVESGYRKVLADPDLDDVEIWEIENSSGGWFHPVHIHLVDFQILSRNGRAPFSYERGPKDVVYVGEGETVRLVMKFEHQRGRYMIHCHNLPHEDHDMMAQFSVGINTNEPDPNHPIEASRPHPITAETTDTTSEEPGKTPAPATTEPATGGSAGATEPTQAAAPATSQSATPPAAENPAAQKDVLSITTARHRLNKDMDFAGTSRTAGTAPAGPASVTLYDVSPGRAATKLGTATTNALGSWSLAVKPGPRQQVTSVKAESSRGGTATRAVDTR
ncbi:multicopper oxidase domain-containing protein [Arthrobacter sp. Leaf137]|uniref:multicopper oxidase domain-containing protein n=1 Tax=Arthrobacter sp. Leaf137 TaxID=1736271 RepID=UPI0006FAE195|nr:multicopper oxidase domain-containing protein [Arthrobacter sp. Leaf137]KQQ80929.1 bilirubin oxidase [Arthrobacter sp. Leaf137]